MQNPIIDTRKRVACIQRPIVGTRKQAVCMQKQKDCFKEIVKDLVNKVRQD